VTLKDDENSRATPWGLPIQARDKALSYNFFFSLIFLPQSFKNADRRSVFKFQLNSGGRERGSLK